MSRHRPLEEPRTDQCPIQLDVLDLSSIVAIISSFQAYT
jgi:hypothetical protein